MPQKYSPSFYVDCVAFIGNDISSTEFISERRIKGTLKTLYSESLAFIKSHLKTRQIEKNFNSIHRNPILNSIAKYILHYSGRGSGIKRAFSINPNIELINDTEKEEFRCIIPRD